MSRQPFFEQEFSSLPEALGAVLDSAVAALAARGWAVGDKCFCARLCLEEALVNAVVHGNEGGASSRTGRLVMREEDDALVISVYDEGEGFDPAQTTPPGWGQLGGRGVPIIKHYMDSVRYDTRRSCLEMVWRRRGRQEIVDMETPSKPLVEFEQRGRVTVATVRAASVLDALNVSEFGCQILDYVKDKPGLRLLLDFRNVKYLSSAALTELLRVNEAIAAVKGSFRLVGLNSDIREVFRITNLDEVFTIYDEELEAALRKYERALSIEAQERAWKDSRETL